MAAADEREKSTIREYWEALLIAIVFVNFARVFVFQAFKIPSGSMEDNLKVGDHIVVNKFIYGPKGDGVLSKLVPLRDVRRGDIIVFRFPRDPDIDFVKRVVGLPGETIAVRGKQVSINGKPLAEPYTVFVDKRMFPGGEFQPEPYRSRDNFGPFRIPPGEYFAMGDNRDDSNDSRFWGTVPRAAIKGRAFLVYWSFDHEPLGTDATTFEKAKELATILIRFPFDTRWRRTFFVVDSRYHYTPGVSAYGHE
ncbi:MAG TPA: signal peptidase I [Thermoanaerobaculia bacterium]|nr:signal peptidase I [Thermoanaerobaculia bacterium]